MRAITGHPRTLAIIGLALSVVMIATGCAKKEPGGASKKHDVSLVKKNQLTICTGLPYAPFESQKGKKVGVQTGTTGEIYIKKQVKEQSLDLKVVAYEDLGAEQQALEGGQIEAIVNDLPVWTEYVKDNPGKFKIAAEFDTGEQYGMAVKTGNKALLKVVNDELKKAKEDGTYDKIYEKWIGRKP